MKITTPINSQDFKLFKSVVNQGIDSHLEAFTKSKFTLNKTQQRFIFDFDDSEVPILVRRLRELDNDDALQWAEDIENHDAE